MLEKDIRDNNNHPQFTTCHLVNIQSSDEPPFGTLRTWILSSDVCHPTVWAPIYLHLFATVI